MRGTDVCQSEGGPQPGRGERVVFTVVVLWLRPTVTSTVVFNKVKVCTSIISARPGGHYKMNMRSGLYKNKIL